MIDSSRLVAKNPAASPAVTRVRKLAAPRPVMKPPRAAAADAQRPALRALQQHHADQGERDQGVDDEQDGGHAERRSFGRFRWAFYTRCAALATVSRPGRCTAPAASIRRRLPQRCFAGPERRPSGLSVRGLRGLRGVVDLGLGRALLAWRAPWAAAARRPSPAAWTRRILLLGRRLGLGLGVASLGRQAPPAFLSACAFCSGRTCGSAWDPALAVAPLRRLGLRGRRWSCGLAACSWRPRSPACRWSSSSASPCPVSLSWSLSLCLPARSPGRAEASTSDLLLHRNRISSSSSMKRRTWLSFSRPRLALAHSGPLAMSCSTPALLQRRPARS